MKPWQTWAFVALVTGIAYATQGWRGVLLIITLVVFWVLFQFSRLTRSMRRLAGRPLGVVANAVMFNAQLSQGMRLMQVLKITDSLGRAVDLPAGADGGTDAEPESFVWTDPAGDAVRVDLHEGRIRSWTLQRAGAADASGASGAEVTT